MLFSSSESSLALPPSVIWFPAWSVDSLPPRHTAELLNWRLNEVKQQREESAQTEESNCVSRQVRFCCIFNHPSLPVCPSTSPFSHPFVLCVDACWGGVWGGIYRLGVMQQRRRLCRRRLLSVFSSANKSLREERKVSTVISHRNSNIWEHACCCHTPNITPPTFTGRIHSHSNSATCWRTHAGAWTTPWSAEMVVSSSLVERLDGRWVAHRRQLKASSMSSCKDSRVAPAELHVLFTSSERTQNPTNQIKDNLHSTSFSHAHSLFLIVLKSFIPVPSILSVNS